MDWGGVLRETSGGEKAGALPFWTTFGTGKFSGVSLWGYNVPHAAPTRTSPSKSPLWVKRLVDLLGAKNDIAPFDDAAFGRKVGELIAQARCSESAQKTMD